MTRTEAGRHCASCRKEIVDFSLMTDEELTHYLKLFPGFACGRFRPDQLDRPIIVIGAKQQGLKYVAARAATSIVMLISFGVQAAGQINRTKIKRHLEQATVSRGKPASHHVNRTRISGTIVDPTDTGIADAALQILQGDTVLCETHTDSVGKFKADLSSRIPDGEGLVVRIRRGSQSVDVSYVVGTMTEKLVVRLISVRTAPQPLIEIREVRVMGATAGGSTERYIAAMLRLQQQKPGFFRRLFRWR